MKYLNCAGCKAKCCNYVSIEFDKPKNKKDCDEILWYLYHKNVHVFVESGAWHVQFHTKCKNLDKNWNCKIYEKRPFICKALKVHECERHGIENPKDITFKTPEQFLEYAKKNILSKKKKSKKR